MRSVLDKEIDRLFYAVESFYVRDELSELRAEFESVRRRVRPLLVLRCPVAFAEGGVELDGVELCRVVSKFVLRSLRIEILQILLTPFGAADVDVEVFRF